MSAENQPLLPPEMLPGMPEDPVVLPRIDMQQRRAFGSVPGLLGRNIDVPPFERLDGLALQRVEPEALTRGLFGVEGNNAVDGLALNTAQYQALVRNKKAFADSIRNKTLAANTLTNDVRTREKELSSVRAALEQKQVRHQKVITGLEGEKKTLATLAEWQRTPGYWRTREPELRAMATAAWELSFTNILHVLKDQHELSPEAYVDMTQALAYRLTQGPQSDRMKYWGGMLGVALRYNSSVKALFSNRLNAIEYEKAKLDTKLDEFYEAEQISPPAK